LSAVTNSSHKLRIISSIFPIDKFIKKIDDDMIQSSILFPTGIESQDFEPTLNQIQTVDSADVLVYDLVLTPIEGLTKYEQEVGTEYIDKMKENVKNLKVGLEYNQ
jgi:ABC-type Zn uptake system ZnuABC Zn-binding protein ZnuA